MKKRLRKKLHKGEFAEYGFDVVIRFEEGCLPTFEGDNIFFDSFTDSFIELMDRLGLSCGGGGSTHGGPWEFYVTAARGSATNVHRERVHEWLSSQKGVASFEVKPLTDAWYGWKE